MLWLFVLLAISLTRRNAARQRMWLSLATYPSKWAPIMAWIVSTDNSGRYLPNRTIRSIYEQHRWELMSEQQFRQHYRFSKDNFERLIVYLSPYWPTVYPTGRPPLPIKQCVLMVLDRLANNINQHSIAVMYDMGHTSVHKYTNIVMVAIQRSLVPRYFRWPSTVDERLRVMDGFRLRAVSHGYTHMPGVCGVMDGSHIELGFTPVYDGDAYRCWKKFLSINVLAVCDSDGRFIHITVGWPGSTNDHTLQQHSNIESDLRHMVAGEYIIADGGFTLTPTVVIPYRNVSPVSMEHQFNTILTSHRGCIERAFGRLKNRWRCLFRLPMHDELTLCRVITTCFILHNFAETHGDLFETDEPVHSHDLFQTNELSAFFGTHSAAAHQHRNQLRDDILNNN